jgi:hypothetical protein
MKSLNLVEQNKICFRAYDALMEGDFEGLVDYMSSIYALPHDYALCYIIAMEGENVLDVIPCRKRDAEIEKVCKNYKNKNAKFQIKEVEVK